MIYHKLRVAIFVSLTWVTFQKYGLSAELPDFPQENIAAPVFISWTSEPAKFANFGSGLLLLDQDSVYLVTAYHVLPKLQNGELGGTIAVTSYPTSLDVSGFDRVEIDLNELTKSSGLLSDQNNDVAAIRFAKVVGVNSGRDEGVPPSISPSSGVKFLNIVDSGMSLFRPQDFVDSSSILIGNRIIVGGFPRSIGFQGSAQYDWSRPLFTGGIVSASDRVRSTVVIDANVFPGNSGGPVWEIFSRPSGSVFKLIGIVTEFIPFFESNFPSRQGMIHPSESNSGYAIVASINILQRLLDKA